MQTYETVTSHWSLPVATRLREASEYCQEHHARGCDHTSQDMAAARCRARYGAPKQHYMTYRCERRFGTATVEAHDGADTQPGEEFLRWQRGE